MPKKSYLQKISIIIPVKNEGKNIANTISGLVNNIHSPFEASIIYDDPQDTTISVATTYLKNHKIKNIILLQNNVGTKKGVVNAIKTGINHAYGRAIVITMADLSDDMSQIDIMYSLIKQGYDIVCASRYMPQGEKIGGPFFKTFLSKTAGKSLHMLFHIPTRDATNAYKMYSHQIFDTIFIESTGGFEYSLEIIIKAFKQGYTITEIPTIWRDREEGKSHFKLWKWLPKYIKTYLLILK